jgi:hypothetical protein
MSKRKFKKTLNKMINQYSVRKTNLAFFLSKNYFSKIKSYKGLELIRHNFNDKAIFLAPTNYLKYEDINS